MTPTPEDKIRMALDRLALFERRIDGASDSEDFALYFALCDVREFIANMRLRLEHGSPGDTIACFAGKVRP